MLPLFQKLSTKKGLYSTQKLPLKPFLHLAKLKILQDGKIMKPLLWSPETPNLYKVLTEVTENGNIS
jgi:beta-galactosidase